MTLTTTRSRTTIMENLPPKRDTYAPSQEDVFSARRLLLQRLPAELAIAIVDLAEYWPKVTSTREAFTGPATVPSGAEEWCYVLSPPIPSYPGLNIQPHRVTFNLEAVEKSTYHSTWYPRPTAPELTPVNHRYMVRRHTLSGGDHQAHRRGTEYHA